MERRVDRRAIQQNELEVGRSAPNVEHVGRVGRIGSGCANVTRGQAQLGHTG